MLKVSKPMLLLIASLVWCAAGFNVCRIGVLAYPPYVSMLNIALSVLVFLLFQGFVFGRLVQKHSLRIRNFAEMKHYFWKFFDGKSFLIMAIMMGGGIYLRASGMAPLRFVAVFYTGLGASLFLAGVLFLVEYIKLGLEK